MHRRALLAAPALFALPSTGRAQASRPLTVGMAGIPTGMDPHFHSSNNNNALLLQIFDPLVVLDTQGNIQPRLAESWRVVDDLTWEFKLRPNIRFHDGTPFEPEDIAFSFERVPQVPNSPGPFTPMVRSVRRVEIVDRTTVRFHHVAPTPFFDRDIVAVMMLSRRIHANATLADFNSGRAMIGTGAYRFVSYSQGERLEIERNPDFWGEPAPWQRAVFRFITNPGARTAALLAGDVDLIDAVPFQDIPRLRSDPRIALFSGDSITTSYLMPDTVREPAPHLFDRSGQPLARNPMRDLRVRQAMSLSIPRQAIVERLFQGQGRPANQFAAPSLPDRIPDLPEIPYDLDRARALLREAGWGDGFRLTVHGPNGWIPGDAELLQAVAQGWTRIGIETRVEVLPPATFFSRATAREFAIFFATFTTSTAANMLRQVLMTRDPATGVGPFNRQHYSNPAVDEPLREALQTMDEARRTALTRQALRAATEDLGVIPVHYLRNNWAGLRSRVRYEPSPLFYTNALLATPAA
ncbi:MAG: ABC transporter substrate-binding protein [Rhodovarius sp.]|nr:ABC transporter substrate-binding protein [Rhodovarius sp.]MDW8315438.1 ABC transporter substrate-binding protein [Rhodovarius sp.]